MLAGHTWATPPLNTHTCKSRTSSDMVLKLFLLCFCRHLFPPHPPPSVHHLPSCHDPSSVPHPKYFNYFFCYCCYYVSLSLSSSSVPTHKTRPWQLRKTRRPRLQLSVALNGVNVDIMLVELNVMEEHCSKDWSDKVVLTKGSDSIVAPLLKLQPDFGGRGEPL